MKMRNIATLLCGVLFALNVAAQPAPVKNAAKSVFTLTTFKADGSLLASSHGVFIDANGTGICDWTPFDGANRAVVMDANGKSFDVECILGANEIYDVAKIKVKGKTTAATIATTPATVGANIYLVGYSVKKPEIVGTTVGKVEMFMEDKYAYYIIQMTAPENAVGCPFVNANGELIGFLQQSQYTTDYHSTDANYIADFQVSGLTANDPVLRRTDIPTAIPDDKEQALLALMLAQQGNAPRYDKTIDMFVEKFPDLPDGYYARAQKAVNANDFAAAQKDMETAIKVAAAKDEAHYDYAKVIYQKELYKFDQSFPAWSLDKAIEEARQAYTIQPLPLYRHLEAQILFSKKEYQQACDIFLELNKTEMRNQELFFEAAQCKTQLQAPKEEVIALLDSAINLFERPYPIDAATYFLYRANVQEERGEYRKAVHDYNQVDTLLRGRLGADFYYKREQCEAKGKLFQQALQDIETATQMAPNEPLYVAEKASLQLRVNMKEEALANAQKAIDMDSEYSDAYLIKGLALIQLGKKKDGIAAMEKAKELGNDQAPGLIEKYK